MNLSKYNYFEKKGQNFEIVSGFDDPLEPTGEATDFTV